MATILIAFLINNLKRYKMKEKINVSIEWMKSACLNISLRLKVWTVQALDRAAHRFNHRLTLAARNGLIFASGIVLTVIIYTLL